MAKKPKGNLLESLLRYEIVLALFTLIGVYYFLTFAPVRMPQQAITSPSIKLTLPPLSSAKKPETSPERTTEVKSASSLPPGNQKSPEASEAKKPEPTSAPSALESPKKKNPEKIALSAAAEPIPSTAGTDSKSPAHEEKVTIVQQPAAKTVKIQHIQTPATTVHPTAGRRPSTDKQQATTRQSKKVKPLAEEKATAAVPKKKSYVIQVGIFIFPETLKHYQQILKDHGYSSFVTTRKRLLPMYRVFLGPYKNLATARKIIGTISKWGDDPFPCRRGNKFYVNVGSFYYQKTARGKISQYRSRGFVPVVFHEPVNVPHHILLVDGFSFNHYPHNALRSIKQLGIPDAFVRNWQP